MEHPLVASATLFPYAGVPAQFPKPPLLPNPHWSVAQPAGYYIQPYQSFTPAPNMSWNYNSEQHCQWNVQNSFAPNESGKQLYIKSKCNIVPCMHIAIYM